MKGDAERKRDGEVERRREKKGPNEK